MAQRSATTYQERLTVPWWWWLLALLILVALAGPPASGVPAPLGAVGLGLLMLLGGVGLWWLGRVRVVVVDAELHVDDARLPLVYVADAIPLDAAGRQELLGPAADPLGFVIQRPWISGAVQVVLADPADPTPYWLISTGHPERLAAALTSGRAELRRGAGGSRPPAEAAGLTPAGSADPGRRLPHDGATADQDRK